VFQVHDEDEVFLYVSCSISSTAFISTLSKRDYYVSVHGQHEHDCEALQCENKSCHKVFFVMPVGPKCRGALSQLTYQMRLDPTDCQSGVIAEH
jgi:hypothetical protein